MDSEKEDLVVETTMVAVVKVADLEVRQVSEEEDLGAARDEEAASVSWFIFYFCKLLILSVFCLFDYLGGRDRSEGGDGERRGGVGELV